MRRILSTIVIFIILFSCAKADGMSFVDIINGRGILYSIEEINATTVEKSVATMGLKFSDYQIGASSFSFKLIKLIDLNTKEKTYGVECKYKNNTILFEENDINNIMYILGLANDMYIRDDVEKNNVNTIRYVSMEGMIFVIEDIQNLPILMIHFDKENTLTIAKQEDLNKLYQYFSAVYHIIHEDSMIYIDDF